MGKKGEGWNDKCGLPIERMEALMSKKHLGTLLIILGVLLAIVSLLADMLGIGNGTGLGWKQILGAVVGGLIAVGGVWWGWGKK